ncbi:hypothetical protein CRYUN_Cryun32bG0102500 [Craigia yunnanensis]
MNIAIGSAEGIDCKKPLEKLSATLKCSIAERALPLTCEGKFSEVSDPRLNGKYVEQWNRS